MLEINIYDVILVFLTGWFCSMAAFCAGAHFVFRTKREPYESFWPKQPKSEAINLDEIGEPTPFTGMGMEGMESSNVPPVVNTLEKQFGRFMDEYNAQNQAIRRAHEEEEVNHGV